MKPEEFEKMMEAERAEGLLGQNIVFEGIPTDRRLSIVRWVLKHIDEHLAEGGSYRYLIYSRMGFDVEAYSALYPYGMNISNNDYGKKD